ncbi:TetR family transcriptional regulator [Shewanella intestini]|uniref:TetR/AcrR family transcriptional regulator n=1 Tax=Shewanella intestini TaxID=2017544 RepID=A0ABS5I1S2_9GAMM|nr:MULTISPECIES: TetR family transcriptional regulator [Shewanella]MBR9727965.1 TetR/AcrR family transcriptional regulator [Shewanella intestini]MRG36484.1 TetR family transcriptional regulator [Shewanella sp. XMDDZSB0408]
MAKRSKAETEHTVSCILDEAFNQVLTIGFEAMSYSTLSDATGISRTGISHHFPRKTEFLVKLDKPIGEYFVQALDFSSLTKLDASWKRALSMPKFCAVLTLFFNLCGNVESVQAHCSVIEKVKFNAKALELDANDCIDNLLGYSARYLLSSRS